MLAREKKLNIMRQDLANKLKITDRQSLIAALKAMETVLRLLLMTEPA